MEKKEKFLEQIEDLCEREKQFEADCRDCLSKMLKDGQVVNLDNSYVELTPCDSFDGYAERITRVTRRDGFIYVYSRDTNIWYRLTSMYGSLTDLLGAVYSEVYDKE